MSPGFRISIAANLVLAGVVATLLWRDRPTMPATVTAPTLPTVAPASVPRPAPRAAGPVASSVGGRIAPETIAQLEQAGISRGVLGSALREDFNRRWDRKLVELEQRFAPRQTPPREYVEFERHRRAELVRELTEALGADGYRAWDKEQTLRTLNNVGVPMSPEEAEQAYRLQKEFDQQHWELEMAMDDGVADRADGAALQAQAQQALSRQLEQLLGKQRVDAMQGMPDPIAEVSRRYGDLNPTPGQASAVVSVEDDYRAREEALAARLGRNPAETADVAAELQALADAREEELRRIFGAAAYDEQKRRNDPTYQTLQQYAGAWGLQDREVQGAYRTLHAYHNEMDRIRQVAGIREQAGQTVNWREINATIEQLRRKTEANLDAQLGVDRVHRLEQNGMMDRR
jgi:hypothetical protein